MEKIRTLIVDDEPDTRKGIKTLLEADSDIQVIGECSNGLEAIGSIEALTPDLVFLDIQMPGKDGFEVLEAIDLNKAPTLVFVTAWDKYALKAFEVSAIDYLLKPFSDERFHQALERAKKHRRQHQAEEFSRRLMTLVDHYRQAEDHAVEQSFPAAKQLNRFLIRSKDEITFVPVEDVDWLEAVGYYTRIHSGKRSHLLRGNLGAIEAQLDPTRFARIHRSTIVNLARIKKLQKWFHGGCLAVLVDGTELKVSRHNRQRLESLLAHLD
jgi:two-component system LytT family response regulator